MVGKRRLMRMATDHQWWSSHCQRSRAFFFQRWRNSWIRLWVTWRSRSLTSRNHHGCLVAVVCIYLFSYIYHGCLYNRNYLCLHVYLYYLSVAISAALSTQQPKALLILRRNAITQAAMQNLDSQIWKSRISMFTKLKLYNICILPIFLYGSDCWAVTKRDALKTGMLSTNGVCLSCLESIWYHHIDVVACWCGYFWVILRIYLSWSQYPYISLHTYIYM